MLTYVNVLFIYVKHVFFFFCYFIYIVLFEFFFTLTFKIQIISNYNDFISWH